MQENSLKMKLEQQQQQQTAMEVEEWPGIHKLGGVQDLLDQNKLLITEINQNHAQQTPESLMRNVLLIKQLNSNMARVVQASGTMPCCRQGHAAGKGPLFM